MVAGQGRRCARADGERVPRAGRRGAERRPRAAGGPARPLLYFGGESASGLERIDRALEIAEALDIPEVLSEALNTKSLILLNDGRWNEATALLRHALAIALQHDKPSAAMRAYNNLVDFADGTDRYADADQLVRRGWRSLAGWGNRYWESSLLGHVYPKYALGLWDELMASLDEILPRSSTGPGSASTRVRRVRHRRRGASG